MAIPAVSLILAVFCLVSLLLASSEVLPYVAGIYVVACTDGRQRVVRRVKL